MILLLCYYLAYNFTGICFLICILKRFCGKVFMEKGLCSKKQWEKMAKTIRPEEAKYIRWLNAHDKELNKHAGKWIIFKPSVGIIAAGRLEDVQEKFKEKYPGEVPFVYRVPRKDEGEYVL